jgi:glutamate-1-semialdehyde 2,1-aminomutase
MTWPEKILETYKQRTRKSHTLHENARELLPLGVTSNFRYYEPYPIFIQRARGSRMWDVDGNEYIDYSMNFGCQLVGHANPQILEAIRAQAENGTLYCAPNELETNVAAEICKRFRVEMVRFTNSGTESTSHVLRLARHYTKREKIIKFEGAFHGVQDALLVSTKPKWPQIGDEMRPHQIPSSFGIPPAVWQNTLVASFNNIESVKIRFRENPKQIAAAIIEPVMCNAGIITPEPEFLQALKDVCEENRALLIYDEVKTGLKIAPGGACEYYGVPPHLICLAKAIGGGLPLGAFAGKREVMQHVGDAGFYHAGTYSGNPLSLAAGLVTLRDILTPEVYPRLYALSKKLADGYNAIIAANKLPAHSVHIGALGMFHLLSRPLKNYRDWLQINRQHWQAYWFSLLNRGIIAHPPGHEEQWTISVAHTDKDIEAHLAAFEEVAAELVKFIQQK